MRVFRIFSFFRSSILSFILNQVSFFYQAITVVGLGKRYVLQL